MFFINGCNSMSNPDSKTAMCLEFVVIFHHSKGVSKINKMSKFGLFSNQTTGDMAHYKKVLTRFFQGVFRTVKMPPKTQSSVEF